MSNKILVTGAGGYIGSHTCDQLLSDGYSVVALDNFSRGFRDPLELFESKYGKDKITILDIDLRSENLENIITKINPDCIIHFAGYIDVGESWKASTMYIENNLISTYNLLNAMKNLTHKKIIFSSTCAVYGNAQYTPIDENHPMTTPQSPYGLSKVLCEEAIIWHSNLLNYDYIIFRYFNVTGASDDASLGDSKNPTTSLIQNAIKGVLGISKFELNYTEVNTKDKSPIRDYINVVDLARAHVLGANYLCNGSNIREKFNLGTGTGNSVLEVIAEIKKILGKELKVVRSEDPRENEADIMIADYTKAKTILGWTPSRTLAQSIDSLHRWYSTHPKGWSK